MGTKHHKITDHGINALTTKYTNPHETGQGRNHRVNRAESALRFIFTKEMKETKGNGLNRHAMGATSVP